MSMKRNLLVLTFLLPVLTVLAARKPGPVWPDGTPMSTWFTDPSKVDDGTLGNRYVVTDYGVCHANLSFE